MNKKITKVVVGLSGGVDSAVSALLLKQQGLEVIGAFMQNWQIDQDDPYCTAEQDLSDARAVADHIGIPLQVINFSQAYWNHVFQYCLDEFKVGRTPNPDIWCNKEIKFKAFLEYALQLGADFLATGHYARKTKHYSQFQLLKGEDPQKDQSYFLYTLGQHELKHALFPIGELTKPRVREIAKQANLINFAKKNSTGICFIGERKFKDFLSEYLLDQPCEIKTPDGKIVGQHDGLMFYTIGQRKGLRIGGQKEAAEAPWYVIKKEFATNTLIVAQEAQLDLLYHNALICDQLHWVSEKIPHETFKATAKIRYRQSDQTCTITPRSADRWHVAFEQKQRAITPGQAIVFYQNEICLGGGTFIEE